MPEELFSNKAPDITAEACAWIAQLETGNMSSEDQAALKEWIGRSPRHFEEIRKIARLSADTDLLAGMAGSIGAAARERREAVSPPRPWFDRHWRPALAACAMAVLVAGAGFVTLKGAFGPAEAPYIVATTVGGLEERTLSDGTVVKLNTDSQIEVDFDSKQRRVRLLKGEAFFQVAHNSDWPFLVTAGDKTEPEPLTKISAEAPLFLDAGQKLSLVNEGAPTLVAAVSPREITSELSWREGLLDFSERPLNEIVGEVNRYTNVRIEITDPELSQMKFGGIFRTGEIEPLLDALELSADVEVERVSDTYVRIHRAAG